jgi:PQQ-dependent dehydrogenase (methanol/ethanol family)
MTRGNLAALAACLLLSACGGGGGGENAQRQAQPPQANPPAPAANVTQQRLLNAASEPSQWLTNGGDYQEWRYSGLARIDRSNVSQLELVWFTGLDTNVQQNSTPLHIDGALYVSTAWSKVYALDARTGAQLWQYDPQVPDAWASKVCCGLKNRGVAAWDGKIYVGTLDGRLVALDARTGRVAWSVLTIDAAWRYAITGAPRVAKGMVLIGNAGAEYGVRGYLSAYDAETGRLLWRFYTVPGEPAIGFENRAMQAAAATWSGDWWRIGGGGAVWNSIVYDPKTDLVYFGTANGTPWNQRYRDPSGGDNLYIASIVAVHADTGDYAWHYQTTPGDTWDYDATSSLTIADLDLDGRTRHVVMQANKNGFFYVLDGATGELLRAQAFTQLNWADGVDMTTGRPRVRPESRYGAGQDFNGIPGPQGARGWHPSAFSPQTGLLYIPTQEAYFAWVHDPAYVPSDTRYNLGIDLSGGNYYQTHPDAPRGFVSFLQAWDPITGRQVWRGPSNAGPTGGALATAGGLVFHGGGSSQVLRAYDAATGAELWSTQGRTGIFAGPISYEVDGRQYIAVVVGSGASSPTAANLSRVLVFALRGNTQLPP